jgi:predicted chitinase
MIQLTAAALRQMYPRAPAAIFADLAAWQSAFDAAGITASRTRLAYCCANMAQETGRFTIPNLTESIAYSASRACQVWPNRFRSPDDCYRKVGSYAGDPQFGRKLIDNVYGNRMGNRPGTHDGSRFIGRGAPQVTGRDGYREVGRRCGLDLENRPELAAAPEHQAQVMAAFWTWKNLNAKADAGDFTGCVRVWNGGAVGLAERRRYLASFTPIIRTLPGAPPTSKPRRDAIAAATQAERTAIAGGVVAVGTGAAGGAFNAGTAQPGTTAPTLLPPLIGYSLLALGVVVLIVAGVGIARKRAALIRNWI